MHSIIFEGKMAAQWFEDAKKLPKIDAFVFKIARNLPANYNLEFGSQILLLQKESWFFI